MTSRRAGELLDHLQVKAGARIHHGNLAEPAEIAAGRVRTVQEKDGRTLQ